MDKNERSLRILSRKTFVSRCRKFSQGKLALCHFFRVSKNFFFQKVMSHLSVDFFRLAVTKNFGRVTFLCIFSENFLQRKSLWIRGVREDQNLPSVFLCLTVSKHFVGELFCALFQNFRVPKKFMDKNERVIRILSRKYFVSRHRKFSHGKLLLFHLIRVSRNLLFQRVMLQFSVKLFVSQ